MLREFSILTLVVVAAVSIAVVRAYMPRGLLKRVTETLDPRKRMEKAKRYAQWLTNRLNRAKERVATYSYEISLYVGEEVIAFVVVLLAASGLACDGADVPLQLTFWRATLDQQSPTMVWSLTIGTIIFFTMATFCALVAPALVTTMVPTWKGRSIVLSIIGGIAIVLSATLLGAVRFVDPQLYALLKSSTFWAQVILTEGLPVTAGALHATAFLYGRPRSVRRKKVSVERGITEIELVIDKLDHIAGKLPVNATKGENDERSDDELDVSAELFRRGRDAEQRV